MAPALALLLGACAPALYTPPHLAQDPPPAHVVTDSDEVTLVPKNLHQEIYITRVDDASTYRLCWNISLCWPKQALLPPGRHHLQLHYEMIAVYANALLWLDAEPGQSYIVRRKLEGYGVRLWVEEVGTGKVVGGIAGSEPP